MKNIAIIGLGYVGLPLAKLFLEKHYTVYGIDIDAHKIEAIKKYQSYLSDISHEDLKTMIQTNQFHVSTTFENIKHTDVIILCVPTPLTSEKTPNISYIKNAMTSCQPYLKPEQLLILESSTYPGTTEEIIVPLVEEKGFAVGENIYVAYSPERIDPGQKRFALEDIPKIVGGITDNCTKKACQLYESIFQQVVPVSSAKVAEMSKLVENAQRLINISFINEVAIFCDSLNIDVWEVIHACSTKPFGFTPYYPGPGIGGHCIPVDPLFLLWKAKEKNTHLSLIESSIHVNDMMPHYIVSKVIHLLDKPIQETTIFVIGVTYKKDVNDIRESRALLIIEQLLKLGVKVYYHDPFIPELKINHITLTSTPIHPDILQSSDCTLILTDHSNLPYDMIIQEANQIIDTRNAIQTHLQKHSLDQGHLTEKRSETT